MDLMGCELRTLLLFTLPTTNRKMRNLVALAAIASLLPRACEALSPASPSPLSIVFVGNSYTGGTQIGRICDVEPQPADCEQKAIPGDVTAAFDAGTYPGAFDYPPTNAQTLVDHESEYHAYDNPHRGDVPGKVKLLADCICSGDAVRYAQNSQSAFTTRLHAGQASTNEQYGTLNLLDSIPHDVVVVQPQSTEYLDGATSTRIDALEELLKTRDTSNAGARYYVQQTWPRRESDTYNQICSTTKVRGVGENKQGYLESVNGALDSLGSEPTVPTFTVIPTGAAFIEFAKLACGADVLPPGECALDETVACPIFFGDSDKISLYHEDPNTEGTHQSEEIGAWLSAAVIYGMVQSASVCYVSEVDVSNVMPTPSPGQVADTPTGVSLHYLVAESARLALEDTFGPDIPVCSGGPAPTEFPTQSEKPTSSPSTGTPTSTPSETPTGQVMLTRIVPFCLFLCDNAEAKLVSFCLYASIYCLANHSFACTDML